MGEELFNRVLLIDTCGQSTGVSFCHGASLIHQQGIANCEISANIIATIQEGLHHVNWSLREPTAIGVVAGPGSFTGVRVGVSVAQAMGEALEIPVMAISRLRLLSCIAGLTDGLAILNAGRNEFFVREEPDAKEYLQPLKNLESMLASRVIVVAEAYTAKLLGLSNAMLYEVTASDALNVIIETHCRDQVQPKIAPNYVSSASDIYETTRVRLHDVD
jgi:tRNA threonylcarbamoyladenosine biosynthesis protein TsaB